MQLRAHVVLLAWGFAGCSGTTAREPTASSSQLLAGAAHVSDPIVIPSVGSQPLSSLSGWAAGPNGYLLLWGGYATRMAPDGASLDPAGILLGTATGSCAAAVHTGVRWLVACQSAVVALENDGSVGASTPVPSDFGYIKAMSWGSDRALLTSEIGKGLFFDGSGAAIGSAFPIFPTVASSDGGSVVFNGSVFVVAETRTRAPVAEILHTVTNDGPAGSATFFTQSPSNATAWDASLTSNGATVLATYTASPPTCTGAGGGCTPLVTYQQIAEAGPDGTITLGASWQPTTDVLATAFGNQYLLWGNFSSERRDSEGALVSGPVSSPNVTTQQSLVPALDASELLAIRQSPVTAQRLDPNLELLDAAPFAPMTIPFDVLHPSAAFDGTDYLVSWESQIEANVNQRVSALRVTPAGSLVDSTPLTVATEQIGFPFTASNGDGFLVGWQGAKQPGLAAVAADGAVSQLDLGGTLDAFSSSSTLASDGNAYLFTWSASSAAGPGPGRAALFSATGLTNGPVDFGPSAPIPASAFDGENYVLVWAVTNGTSRDTYAARISPALELLDTTPKLLFSYTTAGQDATPALASDGQRSVLVWLDGELTTVRCTRLERDLTVDDPGGVVVGSATLSEAAPRVAWDGSAYWIGWSDAPASGSLRQILARRFGPELMALDDTPVTLTNDMLRPNGTGDASFAFASGPTGELLVTYTRDDRLATHATAIRARLLSTEAGGGAGGFATSGAGGFATSGAGAGGFATSGAGAGGFATSGAGGLSAGGVDGGGLGVSGAGANNAGGGFTDTAGAGASNEAGGSPDSGDQAGQAGSPESTGGTSTSNGGAGTVSSGGQAGTAARVSGGSAGRDEPEAGTAGSRAGSHGTAGATAGTGTAGGRSGAGGTAPAAGSAPPTDAGCGCSVPRPRGAPSAWLAAAPLLLGLRRRRMRQRARRKTALPA